MIQKILHSLFGSRNERLVKKLSQQVVQINALEPEYQALSDDALLGCTAQLKARFQNGETLDQLLPFAFAATREAGRRTLGMRHFDVQLIGGMVLHHGKIAEMSTGEGKTLVATLAAYLNALSGKSVYVVSVNDYLIRRDAEWMRPLYAALGLSVGIVVSNQPRPEKQAAYKADIVYATNNELGFDYLRDRMAYHPNEQVQGFLGFAIVDEVDSILIDEARTPLIISGAAEDSSALYMDINARVIPQLILHWEGANEGDYSLDEKTKQAFLTEMGHQKVERLLGELGLLQAGRGLYDPMNIGLMHHISAALRAHALFRRDVDYIVSGDQVVIVDEHTGRTMPGRRWSDGLHQAIEAKEGVTIQQESQTLASITFQNFFRLYEKLAGMTGTADTEAYEFQQIYGLEVVVIPTNRPCQRKDASDLIYLSKTEKFEAIVEAIEDSVKREQPVLVGTISIETSEELSAVLRKKHIKHNVLNAKYHEQEAAIIADAGRPGAVTIATNMAGRGTDIVLGGALASELKAGDLAWQQRHDAVLAAGGLLIIGTERHESRRIDNQLRGRSGRQGDQGASQFYLSLEDSLMRIFASDRLSSMMRKLGVKKGEAITHPWVTKAIENAQRKVEGHHFDIRKQLLQYDDVANEQRKAIYTERDGLLASDSVRESIESMREEVVTDLVHQYMPPDSVEELWNIPALESVLLQELALPMAVRALLDAHTDYTQADVIDHILNQLKTIYAEKQVKVGEASLQQLEKSIILHALDIHWKEHLAALEGIRQSIHLRGYAQKDPKQEYKREAFNLFGSMLGRIRHDVVSALSRLQLNPIEAPIEEPTLEERHLEYQHPTTEEEPELRSVPVSRNDPCPCGSEKKFKYCHGALV